VFTADLILIVMNRDEGTTKRPKSKIMQGDL